jgi:hypothetical protein
MESFEGAIALQQLPIFRGEGHRMIRSEMVGSAQESVSGSVQDIPDQPASDFRNAFIPRDSDKLCIGNTH